MNKIVCLRLLSVLLTAVLLFAFTACSGAADPSSDKTSGESSGSTDDPSAGSTAGDPSDSTGGDPSDSTADPPSESSSELNQTEPSEPAVTEDPLKEEKEAVKAQVLSIMAEDSRQDPSVLFENFFGDYSIPDFAPDNDYAAALSRIWQKDGVTVIEYKDGSVEYALARNGYLFSLTSEGGNTAVTSVTPLADPAGYIPSIFSDFGIDISDVYTASSAEEEEAPSPLLTADMLTVSDDLTVCTFSDEYLREVAAMLCASMGYSAEQTDKFMSDYSGSGVYTADSNTVEFVIKGSFEGLGAATVTVSHSVDDRGDYRTSVKMEYTLVAEGMILPTTTELAVYDVEYDGDTPITAGFDSRTLISDGQMTVQGIVCTFSSYEIKNIYLNCSDPEKPSLSASVSSETNTEVLGQTVTETSSISLDCRFGVRVPRFSYMSATNSISDIQLMGENIALAAPEGAEIPPIVYELADKAYYDIVM